MTPARPGSTRTPRPGARYQDLGPDHYEQRRSTAARQVSRHVGKISALGYAAAPLDAPRPPAPHECPVTPAREGR